MQSAFYRCQDAYLMWKLRLPVSSVLPLSYIEIKRLSDLLLSTMRLRSCMIWCGTWASLSFRLAAGRTAMASKDLAEASSRYSKWGTAASKLDAIDETFASLLCDCRRSWLQQHARPAAPKPHTHSTQCAPPLGKTAPARLTSKKVGAVSELPWKAGISQKPAVLGHHLCLVSACTQEHSPLGAVTALTCTYSRLPQSPCTGRRGSPAHLLCRRLSQSAAQQPCEPRHPSSESDVVA